MTTSNRPQHAPNALTLVCLAHAGGSVALYRDWQHRLPPFVQVRTLELPGHGIRRSAPPHTEWSALIAQLTDELLALVAGGAPFALFGHSMGALVGLELMHALRQRGERAPVWFGASATVSPARRKHETHWLTCSQTEMIDCLRERGGTPAELLDDADFIDFMLPLLRADFHLCGVHPAHIAARVAACASTLDASVTLDCPIDVFVGRDDPATAHVTDVGAWAEQTRGACAVHWFDGGHFFIDTAHEAVLAVLANALAQHVQHTPRAGGMTKPLAGACA